MTATCKDKLAEEVSSRGQVMVDDSIYLSIYIYNYMYIYIYTITMWDWSCVSPGVYHGDVVQTW